MAQEFQHLRVANKSQIRELVRAIDQSTQLDEDRAASSRSHRRCQRTAEKERAELEDAYLLTVDREVSDANELLSRESNCRAHNVAVIFEMQRAQLTAEANAAMANQASSPHQMINTVAQASNQHLQLVRQWVEQRSADSERNWEAARE